MGTLHLKQDVLMLCIAAYFGYITLVLVWFILGAVLDPDTYLPLAASALAFISFVFTNARNFRSKYQHARKQVAGRIQALLLKQALESLCLFPFQLISPKTVSFQVFQSKTSVAYTS